MKIRHLKFRDIGLFTILVIGINVPVLVFEHYRSKNEIQFLKAFPEEARRKAKMDGKPIFLEINKTWCIPCLRLRNHYLSWIQTGTPCWFPGATWTMRS